MLKQIIENNNELHKMYLEGKELKINSNYKFSKKDLTRFSQTITVIPYLSSLLNSGYFPGSHLEYMDFVSLLYNNKYFINWFHKIPQIKEGEKITVINERGNKISKNSEITNIIESSKIYNIFGFENSGGLTYYYLDMNMTIL